MGRIYHHWFRSLLLLAAASCVMPWACTHQQQVKNGWENEYLGTTKGMPFYPDNFANYWVYTFNPDKHRTLGYCIRGVLPAARYMSLNLYLHDTRQSIGSLIDREITPSGDSAYEVWILPTGDSSNHENALFSDPSEGKHSIFLRYYDPEGDHGQVPLPTITAFDLASQEEVPLPHLRFNIMSADRLRSIIAWGIGLRNGGKPFFPLHDKSIFSYRHSGKGFFPNHDNAYLIIPIEKRADEVGILRFKPPTYSKNRDDFGKDVRYWSLAFGLLNTQNPFTLRDREVITAPDEYVYVLIGDSVATSREECYNHIPWRAKGKKAVILYRNLLTHPDFPHSIQLTDAYDPDRPVETSVYPVLEAYAPWGKVIPIDSFRKHGFDLLRNSPPPYVHD